MIKVLRQVIFWTHLVAGIGAGVVIAVMCFTGVALAFEKEIISWADGGVKKVTPGGEIKVASVEQAFAKVTEAYPEIKPSGVTISTDPAIGILVSAGRTNAFYVNPHTGTVSAPASLRVRGFMNAMIEWHRFLAQQGDNRTRGKMINGACNVAFLFLVVSGIYLWWPRNWSLNALRGILLFNGKLSGKARDWNWHNVIGFWSAPVLIVLTATAMPISYKWAGDLIYKLTGTEAPAQGQSPGGGGPRAAAREPERAREPAAAGGNSMTIAAMLEAVGKEIPAASQITLRSVGRGPLTVTVKEKKAWPRFSTVQLTLNAKTGAVEKKETYADSNAGRKVRSWTRFLHTGEALGPIGQAVAGLASFGGLVLVWTGFALAVRRFFGKKRDTEQKEQEESVLEEVAK